jgi:hypothetical protein
MMCSIPVAVSTVACGCSHCSVTPGRVRHRTWCLVSMAPPWEVLQIVEVVRFQCGQASQRRLSALSARTVSGIRSGPVRMTAWRLQGSLRVAAVWRMRRYQSISWESLVPLAGDVLGYIATSQWNCGWSLGDRMGKLVMKTSRAWVGHSCCKSVLMLVAVEPVSSSVMWKDVSWVRLSASASGQPMLSIARIWRCCSHRVASGDYSETFWWLWGPTRWM